MTEIHPSSLQLTMLADEPQRLGDARRAIEHHVGGCVSCAAFVDGEQALRLRLGRLPRHDAPAALLRALRADPAPGRLRRFWTALRTPWIAAPAGIAFAAAAAFLVFAPPAAEPIPVESLVAAHARYQVESSVPSGDLVASAFSAHLASYDEPSR